ncbi:MAG: substrate-binding domain-containing protein [Acidimicrobiales bacterium]|nr:substrate-binding domain-containing protein [Acidimicrobiales bacterium]
MIRRLSIVVVAIVATAGLCGESDDPDIAMVPSSFTDLTAEIDRALDDDPVWVIAGSSRLVRQLADGAAADLLITADAATMEQALADGLVDTTLGVVARNRLVFAVAPDNPGGITSVEDLGDGDRFLGVCAPEVPCGRLAAAALDELGIEVAADTEEPNVRALALKIARGELDGGLIYATDARAFSLDTVDDVRLEAFVTDYVAASVHGGTTGIPAFLRSDEGRALLESRGFLVP